MQQLNEKADPNQKRNDNTENTENQNLDEGVFVYNNDGTPMDTSERTYVSVDLPEENVPDTTSDDVE
jgi:hypothetical protein